MTENERTARQDLVLNLKAAGFKADMIKRYLAYWKAGKVTEQLELLSCKRAKLLEQIHREEKQIHCLDYLVYQIKKAESPENG